MFRFRPHRDKWSKDEFEYVMAIDVARVEGKDNTIIDVFKLRIGTWITRRQILFILDHLMVKHLVNRQKNVREILRKYQGVIRIMQDTM